jgi:hypothetical protein
MFAVISLIAEAVSFMLLARSVLTLDSFPDWLLIVAIIPFNSFMDLLKEREAIPISSIPTSGSLLVRSPFATLPRADVKRTMGLLIMPDIKSAKNTVAATANTNATMIAKRSIYARFVAYRDASCASFTIISKHCLKFPNIISLYSLQSAIASTIVGTSVVLEASYIDNTTGTRSFAYTARPSSKRRITSGYSRKSLNAAIYSSSTGIKPEIVLNSVSTNAKSPVMDARTMSRTCTRMVIIVRSENAKFGITFVILSYI